MPLQAPDPADEAMCARARERFAADRKSGLLRRRKRHAAMPSLIIIGGLKCGTTSIHHYLGLHPEIQMSKPKELNFFCESSTGTWASTGTGSLRRPLRGARRVLPPLHEPPALRGGRGADPRALPDAKLLYMVRDPITRILSHWVHATGAGYETRRWGAPRRPTSRQAFPVLDAAPALPRELRPRADRGHHPGGAPGRPRGDHAPGLRLRRRRPDFTSEQFDREWENSWAKAATDTSSWRS